MSRDLLPVVVDLVDGRWSAEIVELGIVGYGETRELAIDRVRQLEASEVARRARSDAAEESGA